MHSHGTFNHLAIRQSDLGKDNRTLKRHSSVLSYGGFSLGGFHQNNATKENQDSIIMMEDRITQSLLFVCMDGHGINGGDISQFVKQEIEQKLFTHRLFRKDSKSAIEQVLAAMEEKLLNTKGHKWCEFSGTTLSLALVRGQTLITAHIGDSRIILANHSYRNRSNSTTSRTTSSSSSCSSMSGGVAGSNNRCDSLSSESSSCSLDFRLDRIDSASSMGSAGSSDGADVDALASSLTASNVSTAYTDSAVSASSSFSSSSDDCNREPFHGSATSIFNFGNTTDSDNNNNNKSNINNRSSETSLSSSSRPSRKRIRQLVAESLTVDHKPDVEEEYTRILRAGGRVFSVRFPDGTVGPPRVWLDKKNIPGLAMSRSIGDFAVTPIGVVSTPDVREELLDDASDCMLVLATDGLWDHMNNAEAVDLAATFARPEQAAAALAAQARARWIAAENCSDDITVCVVFLRGLAQ